MADNITIKVADVEKYVSNLNGAAGYFLENHLVPSDNKSTISANENGKNAYGAAQSAVATLGVCLEQEAKNIRSLGASFKEYDEMLAKLWESGTRYPRIKAAE